MLAGAKSKFHNLEKLLDSPLLQQPLSFSSPLGSTSVIILLRHSHLIEPVENASVIEPDY